jgi:predicted MFS family arabinose efflux permease
VSDTPATRLATRLSFFAAGIGAACWAPLVPYAKTRLAIDDGTLGLLLLCLGIGSVLIMPITGGLVARVGSRAVILAGGVGYAAALPGLAIGTNVAVVAAALLLFGAALGAMDVAMNIHAVEVERGSREPLMSGFHALFSLGGVVGAGGISAMLAAGTSLGSAATAGVMVVIASLAVAAPRYLETRLGGTAPFFVRPRGVVLLLGALAFVAFLVEGAILDWSALLMTTHQDVAPAEAGLAYAVFSVAMTIGRFSGDRVVAALGGRRVLVLGGLITTAGLILVLEATHPRVALAGFLLVGLGASNVVPVLFSQAGRQTTMPSGLAIAAMTAIGYAGILAGPAAMGFVADALSLPAAFAMLAGLMLLVPLCAKPATR